MRPTKKKKVNWAEVRVGVFMLVSFFILLLFVFKVSGAKTLFEKKVILYTYLPSISGLKIGAPVWLNGVEIGQVESIEIEDKIPDTLANRNTFETIDRLKGDIKRYKELLSEVKSSLKDLKSKNRRKKDDILKLEDKVSYYEGKIERLKRRLRDTYNRIQSIKVTMKIESKYEKFLKRDSEVTIGTIGFLGDKYVEISIGRLKEPPIKTKDGIFIEGINEATLRQLMVSANDLLANFGEISKRINSIVTKIDTGAGTIGELVNSKILYASVKDTVDNVDSTFKNLSVITDNVKKGKGSVGKLFVKDDLYKELKQSVANLKVFINKLNSSNGTINKLIKDPHLYNQAVKLVKDIDMVVDKIKKGNGTVGKLVVDPSLFNETKKTLMKMNDILSQVNSGKGTMGKLLKDESLYRDLDDTLSQLGKLIYDIRKNPKKYIKIKFGLF